MVDGSYKPSEVHQFTIENYQTVLSTGGMSTSFRNSFTITIGGTFCQFCGALAAFGLSRLNFGGRTFFYGLIVMMMVVPTQMTFVPVLRLYNKLSLSGTFSASGWSIPDTAAFAVFMLHNFFDSLPDDLFEAAYIDGASVWTTFVRLAIPCRYQRSHRL